MSHSGPANPQPLRSQIDPGVARQLENMALADLVAEATARGIVPERLMGAPGAAPAAQRAQLILLLKLLLQGERLAVEAQLPFVWTVSTRPSPIQFFSEVVMVPWGEEVLFCGPYFPSPRDRPVTIVAAMHVETHAWRTVPTTGKCPNPFMVFKRMPIFFLHDGELYLVYSDHDRNRCAVDSLNLTTFAWSDTRITGPAPPPRDYVDGCCHNGGLFLSGHASSLVDSTDNVVHRLNLATKVWAVTPTTGPSPTWPNGSSIYHGGALHIFSKDSDALHSLELDSFTWTRHTLPKLPEFNARRHSHLIQMYGDELLLLRSCDNFQVNCLNLADRSAWRVIDTVGKRPTKVRTEASFVIYRDTLYTLGGQSAKNHLLVLPLRPRADDRSRHLRSDPWVARLHGDGSENITFTFMDGRALKAHRNILAARSEYFKSLFTGGMSEAVSKSDEIPVLDANFEHFEAMINFFYEKLDLTQLATTDLDFGELFSLASKYLVLDLQLELAEYLLQTVEAESSIQLLRLFSNAPHPFPGSYKKKITAFMLEHARSVTQLPGFLMLCKDEPQLIQDLFAALTEMDESPAKRRKLEGDLSLQNQMMMGPDDDLRYLSEWQ